MLLKAAAELRRLLGKASMLDCQPPSAGLGTTPDATVLLVA